MLFLMPPEIIKKPGSLESSLNWKVYWNFQDKLTKKRLTRNIINILDINWTRGKFTRSKYRYLRNFFLERPV